MPWDFVRRKILRLSRDRWNYQYRKGKWDGLHREENRFSKVKELIRRQPGAAILEIGCGAAVLFRKLGPDDCKIFDGVDISDVAIAAARHFGQEGVTFATGDMQTFLPQRRYDFIIFNESLYYAKKPAQTLARYSPYLADGGSFIITAVANKYTAAFWPSINISFKTIAYERVEQNGHRWDIKMMIPG